MSYIDYFEKEFTPDQKEKIYLYGNLILETNKQFNLTGHKTLEKIFTKLFIDGIDVYKNLIRNQPKKLLDIGTGAGIPGILLKIVYPKLDVTLMDSSMKKITFLNKVISQLGLKGIAVIHTRAENSLSNNVMFNKYDYVTARALAPLAIAAELCTPYLRYNGLLIFPKSKSGMSEYELGKPIFKSLGIALKHLYKFPNYLNEYMNIVYVFVKNKSLPKKYPRKWNVIKNEYQKLLDKQKLYKKNIF